MLNLDVFGLFEHRGTPVEHRVAKRIDKKVGEGDQPEVLVSKDILQQHPFEFSSRFRFLNAVLRAFDLRQPHRGWRIREHEPDENDHGEGNRRRNKKTKPPTPGRKITAEKQNHYRADAMRRVPNGHFGRQLFRRKPMGQHARARRKSHPLEPAVEHPNDAERRNGRAKPEKQVHHGRTG